jgi:putative ABC transport system permease protein
MLKNYLKVAFRNFSKHKSFSAINIAGLAAGLAACLLILLYLQDESSYDRFHEHAGRIYRLIDDVDIESESRHFSAVSAPMGPALAREYPEVEHALRFYVWEEPTVQYGDRRFDAGNVFFGDSTAFDVFTFPLVAGHAGTALRDPYSVVLTETAAARFFGGAAAVGQVLTIGGDDYRVTGVMRDLPRQSHFHFEVLASFTTLEANSRSMVESWWRHDFYTYLLLRDPAEATSLAARLPGFIDRHMGKLIAERDAGLVASLQPLTRIHLHSNRYEEIEPNGSMTLLYFLAAVGLFILLIACFNFINLSTARSAGRAREVGVRKVLGAGRGQLMGQFIGESVAACLVALGLALALTVALLPVVNDLAGKDLALHLF